MKIGDSVKQVTHPIAGQISRKQYDEATDGFIYQVDYADADGSQSHRWFTEAEIEVTADFVASPIAETVIPETTTEGGV